MPKIMQSIKNKAGQMTIIGLFLIFVMLIILGAFMPTIINTVTNISGTPGVDTTTVTMIGLVPLAFVIAILGTIFVFIRPTYGGA